MNSLKKLKRAVNELEKQNKPHPDYLYPGDFVRCKVDGSVYIVTVIWDNEMRVYKWNIISLNTGFPLGGVKFTDWFVGYHDGFVKRDVFWEDSDTDWEVLNIHDKEEES